MLKRKVTSIALTGALAVSLMAVPVSAAEVLQETDETAVETIETDAEDITDEVKEVSETSEVPEVFMEEPVEDIVEETVEETTDNGDYEIMVMDVVDSGSCGDNVTWTIDSDGVLTISGTGDMTLDLSSTPWTRADVTAVEIEYGVTSIGRWAFSNCYNLSSVSIPGSVTIINAWAFNGCYNLTNVTIPESVIAIGQEAFCGCTNLTSIDTLENVTSFGDSVFENCSSLVNVTLSEDLTSLPFYMFKGCTSLENITIPANVTQLGGSIFSGCSNLSEIIFTGSAVTMSWYEQGDSSTRPFSGVTTTIYYPNTSSWSHYRFSLLSGASSWTPYDVDWDDEAVIKSGTCGDSVSYTMTNSGIITISGTGAMYDYANEELYTGSLSPFYGYWTSELYYYNMSDVVIEEGITRIGSCMFKSGTSLINVTIPSTVESIGEKAFIQCSNLTTISIPNSVTSIESQIFSGCSNLSEIVFQGEAPEFADDAFYEIEATAMYPAGYSTWTEDVMQDYGGTITWESYGDPDSVINLKDCTVTLETTNYTYDGNAKKPEVTVTSGSATLEEGTDYTVSYSNNTNAGTATVTVTGKGNCTGTQTKDFTIEAKSIFNCTISLSEASYTYDGSAKKPEVTVTDGSTTLEEGTDYTVSYSNNTNVGTATVTVTGIGNYIDTLTSDFTIEAKSISNCTISLSEASYTYDGSAKKPEVTVTDGSTTLEEGTDYTVSYSNNTNVGTATVTVTGAGNYTGTLTSDFKIEAKSISDCAIDLSETSYIYDGSAKEPEVTVTDGSTTLEEGTDYTVSYSNNTNVGTATVTVTGTGNYTDTLTSDFTIKDADETKSLSDCTINLSKTSYTYDGSAKEPEVTVTDGSAALEEGTDYTVSYSNNTNAGTATVTVTGIGDYTGTVSQTFTIDKASQTVTATAKASSIECGETTTITASTTGDGNITYSSSDEKIATVNSSGKVTGKSAGTAKITVKAAATDNYNSASSTVTIKVTEASTTATAELKKVNGVWGYYEDGVLQTNYTGFASNSSGKWYVEKGIVTKSTNGVFKDKTGAIGKANEWYYVLNSKVQTGFTGLADYKNASGWWYITKGKVDRSVTTVAKNKNGWWYVESGKVNKSYTGFATNNKGNWYVKSGKVSKKENGVFKDSIGAIGKKNNWYYVLNSKVQTSFTGLADYSNSSGWWYITKGKVDRSYNGLAKNKNGWFYLTNGKVNRSFTGLATNKNGTWYVKSGKVQKSFTGTVTINGTTYSVTNGKV